MKDITEDQFKNKYFKWFQVFGFEMIHVQPSTMKQKIKTFAKNFYFWFVILSQFLHLTLILTNGIKKWRQLNNIILSLPVTSQTVIVIFRILTVNKHRTNIVEIFEIFYEKLKQIDHEKFKVDMYFKEISKFNRVGLILVVTLVQLGYILYSTVSFFVNGTAEFPVNIWLPFDHTDWRVYWCIQFWLFWVVFNIIIISFAMDSLLFSIITITGLIFDELKAEIEAFGMEITMEEINTVVKKHDEALEIVGKLEEMYAPTFLFLILQSSVSICSITFELVASNVASEIAFYVPALVKACLQSFICCHLGQKLTDSCKEIAQGAYNCDWPNFKDIKMGKAILMIMKRSQRSKVLSALKFRQMTHKCFKTVYKFKMTTI